MEAESSRGEKIWNGLVRYFYQKTSPTHLFAMMILVGLCSNDREATNILEPGNDYGMASNSNDGTSSNDATSEQNVFGHFLEKLAKAGASCYRCITVKDITRFMRESGWGAQYADAVTEINERHLKNQNDQGSANPSPDDGNTPLPLLTDPITEREIGKETLIYLQDHVSPEDILALLKATPWSKNYVVYIEDFIKTYQRQNSSS